MLDGPISAGDEAQLLVSGPAITFPMRLARHLRRGLSQRPHTFKAGVKLPSIITPSTISPHPQRSVSWPPSHGFVRRKDVQRN
jgi:hypothetical protein